MLYLYPKNTIDFTNNGDPIHHSYDEHVIRDDGFYLTFNLLLDKEEGYKKIKKEMIVSADTPDGINQFRIYDIKNKSTVVEVTAVQLMYDFDNKEVNPFSLKNSNGSQVISRFKGSFKSTLGQFTMDSSVTETHDFATNNEDDDTPSHNALEVLNRITNRWDSELMLNGFDIRMIKRLGAKTDALLYEKKNISEFEDASSVSGMITRIHATSKFTPEGKEDEVTLSVTVDSPLINEYAQIYEKSYVNNDCRTEAELIAWTKLKYSTENVDKPSRSITVSTNIIDGTEINYGDDLVLKYLVHDVDEIIRCVGYDYDPIKNTYYSVTLGDWKDSFLNTVTSNIIDNTNKQLNQMKNSVTYIAMSANGKNRNAYGPDPVPNPINGDQWYYYEFDRPNDVEFRVYQDGFWVKVDFFATKKEVEDVLEQADLDRTKAEQDFEAAKQTAKEYTDAQVIAFDTKFEAETGAIRNEVTTGYNNAIADGKTYTDNKSAEFSTQLNLVKADVSSTVLKANDAVTKADKAITDVGFLKPDVATAKSNAATALSTAQTSLSTSGTAIANAQTALNAYNDLEIGGRNLLLETSTPLIMQGQNIDNQTAGTNLSYKLAAVDSQLQNLNFSIGDNYAISFDWEIIGNNPTGSFRVQFNYTPYGINGGLINIDPNKLKGRATFTGLATSTWVNSTATRLGFRLDNVPTTVSIKITNMMFEKSNKPSNWSPNPEDVQIQMTAINGELATKVSQTTFNTLSGTVGTHTTQISQTQTALLAKAESSLVNTIKGTVDAHTTQIKVVSDGLEVKAESSLVNTVKGTVDSHTTQINANSTAITARLTSAQVETLLAGKQYVNQTTLNATSSGLTAQITQVSTNLDNLQIGGTNLIPGTSKAYRYLQAGGWGDVWADGGTDLLTKGIVAKGETYTLRVLLDTGAYPVKAFVRIPSPNNLYRDFVGNIVPANSKGYSTVTFTVPQDATGNVIAHALRFEQNGTPSHPVGYGKVKLEKGSKPTDWSPAPEDMATLEKVVTIEANIDGINTLVASKASQTQVTQLDGQITTKVESATFESRLTQLDGSINLRVGEVQTNLDKLEIGGRNLLTGTTNEFQSVTFGGWDWYYSKNVSNWNVNDPIVGRMFLKPATSEASVMLHIRYSNGSYNQIRGNVIPAGSSGYSTVYAVIPNRNDIVQIQFSIRHSIGSNPTNMVQYKEIKVEKGTKATDWTPAPEDMADKATLLAQINLSTEGVLIQGKVIQLDGQVNMDAAFINKMKAFSIEAVNADIANIRTKVLTADVITSTNLKVDNAMMDKLTANTAVVNYLFTKTAFVDNLNAKTLTAITANITSIRSQVLIANVVQANHLQADAATITKLFASDANVNVLTTKTAFINSVKAIDIAADRITAGTLNAALVNIINLNASKISTGTITGANSNWNLNTGIMSFTNPSTGDIMYLDQGQIKFQNGAQGRNLKYNAEGLVIEPYSTNTGTSRNTMLRLQGGGVGSYQYIQLESGAGISQRITGLDDKILLQHSNNSGYVEITNYRGDTYEGKLFVGDITIKDANNDGLRIVNNRIESAIRSGSHNIFITPQGTGSVIVGDRGLANYWNIHASAFLTRSTRESKTNINPYSGDALSILKTITVSTFNMKQDLNKGINDLKVGFIAEDSVPIAEKDGLGRMVGINTYTATAYLVKATQELDEKVTAINSLATAANSLAINAMNKVIQTDGEVQQMKNKIIELEKEIKTLKGAA